MTVSYNFHFPSVIRILACDTLLSVDRYQRFIGTYYLHLQVLINLILGNVAFAYETKIWLDRLFVFFLVSKFVCSFVIYKYLNFEV